MTYPQHVMKYYWHMCGHCDGKPEAAGVELQEGSRQLQAVFTKASACIQNLPT
jgi:hypothetical protein